MKTLIARLAVAAASALMLASAAPAFADGGCEHCANCPKKNAAQKATATAEKPADKKPEGEKPKCQCQSGKDCACSKDGGKCACAKPEPKAA